MSESESDQDLNVSQYDVDDNLNAYGSTVYSAQEESDAEIVLPSQPARTQVSSPLFFMRIV